jgi:3-deoxy-manno-octulosonate cytidylyltransferase (CMP-KDO synthetase)
MFVKPTSPASATDTIILIPARLASSRLPDKPLAEIGGVPMIVQVGRRACAAAVGPVVVACAEQAIADAVAAHGGDALLTDPDLPSGTDRICQALAALDPERGFQRVINLQGDLPTLEPAAIRAALEPLSELGCDIGTLAVATEDPEEMADPSVV